MRHAKCGFKQQVMLPNANNQQIEVQLKVNFNRIHKQIVCNSLGNYKRANFNKMQTNLLKTSYCTCLWSSEMLSCLLLLLLQCCNYVAEAHILVYGTATNQLIEEYNDMPAQFGASLPPNGLKTYAIPANPLNACKPITPPPHSNIISSTARFAAIIERGDCAFEIKVRNAQAAHFNAVIVFNNDGDDLEQMSAQNATGIRIPSVFVGETAGNNLRSLVASGQVVLIINDELPFNINTQLILPFSILIGLCFLIMIFYMVYKCMREERRLRRYRLPKSMLKKLPIIKYTKNSSELSCDTCVICLDEFVEGDKLRVLPCNHPYHSHCIDPWLTEARRVCPICKRKVFTKGEARANRNRQYLLDSVTDTDDDTTPLLQTSTAAAAAANGTTVGGNFSLTNSNSAVRAAGRLARAPRTNTTTRHGTFRRGHDSQSDAETHSDDVNVLLSRRVNPFDRAPNVSIDATIQLSTNNTGSFWSFFRFFRRASISVAAPPYIEEPMPDVMASSQRHLAVEPLMTRAGTPVINTTVPAASNNILNPNLSGSFKEDSDLLPHHSIYEPIAVITPTADQVNMPTTALAAGQIPNEDIFIETPSTHGGIGVVALPNTSEGRRQNSAAARQFLV